MEGGTAIANTLFGEHNPSGKLPLTFPKQLQDSPAHKSERTYPGTDKNVVYEEELFVGYRHFDKENIEPLFPFGHGLSYTTFDYSELVLNQEELNCSDTLQLSLILTNTGNCFGEEVVQLYIADLQAPVGRPVQALKDFVKVGLEPGERRQIVFQLPASALAVYCPEEGRWLQQPGRFEARIGCSSRDILLSKLFSVNTDSKT
jgi:beta-glucosidase